MLGTSSWWLVFVFCGQLLIFFRRGGGRAGRRAHQHEGAPPEPPPRPVSATELRQLESDLWPRVDAFIERMRVTRGASEHTLRAYGLEGLRRRIRDHVAWSEQLCAALAGRADRIITLKPPQSDLLQMKTRDTAA